MHIPRLDCDVALPHASLLSYFRRGAPATDSENTNASLLTPKDCMHSHSTLLEDIERPQIHDEESKFGFWGEHLPTSAKTKNRLRSVAWKSYKRGNRSLYAFCCLWCAGSICILVTFGLFFVLDLAASPFGLGTGMAQRMIYGQTRLLIPEHEVIT